MDMILLVAVLLLNTLISIWNCYVVGTAWKDVMAMGKPFDKVLLWSGVIQAGIGFSMPILIGLGWLTVGLLTSGAKPELTPAEGAQLMQWIFSFWYVAVIFPILGTGLAIWIHSVQVAMERRDFASIAAAGWNSFAQISNTVSAVSNLGGALGDVGEMFGALKGGDSKGKAAVLAIILVIIALVGGFMIAFALVRFFADRTESRLESYGRAQFAR